MNNIGKLMMTLTAGFAAGVVTGILFAPEVGETTRENIKSKAAELGDELDKQYQLEIEKLKSKVSELTDELRKNVANSGLDKKAEELKNKVVDATNDLKEKVASSTK